MNGYLCTWRGKRIEVRADTIYAAQLKAAGIFKAKKSYEVHTTLVELGGVLVPVGFASQ